MARPEPAAGAITAKGHGASVAFDGAAVTITRGSAAIGGKGVSSYPLRQLTGVDLTMPGFSSRGGRFTLVAAGGIAPRRGSGAGAARQDPLTVTFPYPRRREFEALAAAVRDALARPEAPFAAPAPEPAQGLPGQLASLAELHGQGALSDAEFAAAKARLLGGRGGPQDDADRQW